MIFDTPGPADSQLTLINKFCTPGNETLPALIIYLTPDNVKETILTQHSTSIDVKPKILYTVTSNTHLTKCSIFTPSDIDTPLALIERRDFFPDKITFKGQERQSIKNWLQGFGTFKDFPISFTVNRRLYHWKANLISQLALFSDADPERPIAWFERSKKRVVDGVPKITQAWLALAQEAVVIQDEVVVSFLIVEHKLRTDDKATGLIGGRASAFVV